MKKNIITLTFFYCFIFANTNGQDLVKAIWKGDLIKVQKCIDKGASVNDHRVQVCYPLMYAVMEKNTEMVDLLLKNGAKSDTCIDSHGQLGLTVGIVASNKLLEFSGRHLLYNPFYYAVKLDKTDMVKKFCDYGYDVSEKISMTFFDKKVEVDDTNKNAKRNNSKEIGRSIFTYPVIAAAKSNSTNTFNFLLEKGVDIEVKDSNGESALMFSCLNNNLEMFNQLLQKECSVNDTSLYGYTPLMYASQVHGINKNIIDTLIFKGVELNYISSKRQSAFSISCLHNNRELALYLLEKGAIISESDLESNARMYHFSAEYYLIKGDINSSEDYYKKSKQYYIELLSIAEKELSSVNAKKTGQVIAMILTMAAEDLAVSSAQSNQMQGWQNIGMSKSDAYLMTLPYAENMRKMYSPTYEKNKILLYDYQLPAKASVDEQKYFIKNKIKQFEMSIKWIESILTCMDKGLAIEELNACVGDIQLSNE
jgi:ankyrin repeat protein